MSRHRLILNFYKTLRLKARKPSLPSLFNRNHLPLATASSDSFVGYVNSKVNFCIITYNLKCWHCGQDRKSKTDVLCDNCSVIQPPCNATNYFIIFNISNDFDVDQKALTTQYRKLQAILHPDKFSNKSDKERSISGDYSALINKAYNVLQVPLSRAIHMLDLRGIRIEEDQKVTNPKFLMEIMELNEEVEQANDPDQLRNLNVKNNRVMEDIGKEIAEYFRKKQIEKAKEAVIRMKYYNSIKLHINGLLRERGIVD